MLNIYQKMQSLRSRGPSIIFFQKTNKGIVMVNFFRAFVQCDSSKDATIQDVIRKIYT